jgi:hypothetical protein
LLPLGHVSQSISLEQKPPGYQIESEAVGRGQRHDLKVLIVALLCGTNDGVDSPSAGSATVIFS